MDFARGAMYSEGGQGFIVLHSTAKHGGVSRIVPQFPPGEAVTLSKNTVDKVVTEYGVAELRAKTVRERAKALIAVAHPDHRDHLTAEAKKLGYICWPWSGHGPRTTPVREFARMSWTTASLAVQPNARTGTSRRTCPSAMVD